MRPLPSRLVVASGALLGLAVLGGCGGGDDTAGTTTVTTTTTTVSTSATASTVATTTTAPPQTPLPSGREAIDALLAAWRAGDPAAAALVASPEAVEALFAVAPEPGEARGCNSGGIQVHVQCVFRLSIGELQVRAAPTLDGTGFLVDFVILGS